VRDTTLLGVGGCRNKFGGFEGSQAVPASPSGRVRLVCGIYSILIFKEVGATAMERNVI
jgi:hypothetical protein